MAARRGIVADHETIERLLGELAVVDRVLPDYTWPVRVPLEQLRRQVAREFAEAAAMVNALFPHWTAPR